MKVDVNGVMSSIANLEGGQVFYDPTYEGLWMKLAYQVSEEDGTQSNAVMLDSGELALFSENDNIIPLDVKVVNV